MWLHRRHIVACLSHLSDNCANSARCPAWLSHGAYHRATDLDATFPNHDKWHQATIRPPHPYPNPLKFTEGESKNPRTSSGIGFIFIQNGGFLHKVGRCFFITNTRSPMCETNFVIYCRTLLGLLVTLLPSLVLKNGDVAVLEQCLYLVNL